jgi:hypothetical protein
VTDRWRVRSSADFFMNLRMPDEVRRVARPAAGTTMLDPNDPFDAALIREQRVQQRLRRHIAGVID